MRPVLIAILVASLAGCLSVEATDQPASPGALCDAPRQLGRVAVVPTVSWRVDQKEPERREAMIEAGVAQAFAAPSCADAVEIRPVRPSAGQDRESLFKELRSAGVATVIEIDFNELGPLLVLSIPILISTESDVQFAMTATSLASGETFYAVQRDWKRGGAFVIRGAQVLDEDLTLAFADLIEP